jgi:hypothetical protein
LVAATSKNLNKEKQQPRSGQLARESKNYGWQKGEAGVREVRDRSDTEHGKSDARADPDND